MFRILDSYTIADELTITAPGEDGEELGTITISWNALTMERVRELEQADPAGDQLLAAVIANIDQVADEKGKALEGQAAITALLRHAFVRQQVLRRYYTVLWGLAEKNSKPSRLH